MDSKRTYKKIATIFFFLLATFPFWFTLVASLYGCFMPPSNVNINDFETYVMGFGRRWYELLYEFTDNWIIDLIPGFLTIPLRSVFTALGIVDVDIWATLCSWFVWVFLIELLLDMLLCVPKFVHKIMEKWSE